MTGTLAGRVIFHGMWPDSGTVQLSIFQNWSTTPCSWCAEAAGGPPSYYTEAHYFHDPDTTNGDGPDTMTYTISGITLGTYGAVAIGWRAPTVSSIHCDEPVIGLGGAEPYTTDSLPEPVTFAEGQPTVTRDVHAYFSLQAVPGCNERGRIDGVARVNGNRPVEGLLVLFSTFMYTPEHEPSGMPSGYYAITNPSETLYAMTGLPAGTYYVSLWNNLPPPNVPTFYGAYGYTAGSDVDPDPVTLGATAATWGVIHVDISGNP